MSTEPTGRGKKARDRLEAIAPQVEEIVSKLEAAQTALNGIIGKVKGTGEKRTQDGEISMRRSAVEGAPARIEFKKSRLSFYIDFTLSASDSEGLVNIEGCIVYGVSRPLCFLDCPFPKTDGCVYCDRVSRCDRLEHNPLVRFSVNRYGIIRSSGELDDQWRILDSGNKDEEKKKNDKTILDLHYRALDHIWKDALDWTNENILP